MALGLVIKNGTVVTQLGVLKTDIAVEGEKISAIGEQRAFSEAERVIDATGKIVIPGGIDPHTHIEIDFMGEASPETWEQATIAAAVGGTTTVLDHAPRKENESMLDAIKRQFSRAEKMSAIDYTTRGMFVGLSDDSDIDGILGGMDEAMTYGIPTFKAFQIYTRQKWFANDWQLYCLLRRAGELGAIVTIHAENCIVGESLQVELVNQGKTDPRYHGVAKPNMVEDMAIYTCMEMAQALGTRVYIVHTSTREAPDIIGRYRNRGLPVFCETCTHYLWLTDATFDPKLPRGVMYMCSPPLRKQEDVEAMWQGIKAGTVHTVGSDHAPFTMKQKKENSRTFVSIPNGFPGVEPRVPIVFQEGVLKRGLELSRFAEVVSTNAARIFGMYPQKGVIAPGSDADLVIIDPEKRHSLNAADLHQGTDLSVYEGMDVTGWPVVTILRGQVIVENDDFIGKSGSGRFVEGKLDASIMAAV
jgi:dihydropyrimidinase